MLRRMPDDGANRNPPLRLSGTIVYPEGTTLELVAALRPARVVIRSTDNHPRPRCAYQFTRTDTGRNVDWVPVYAEDFSEIETAVTKRLEQRLGARVE
jgi:hypothetical protein